MRILGYERRILLNARLDKMLHSRPRSGTVSRIVVPSRDNSPTAQLLFPINKGTRSTKCYPGPALHPVCLF